MLAAGVVVGIVALALAAVGVVPAWGPLDIGTAQVGGLVVSVAGFVAVLAAQQAMGRSWRIGGPRW